MDEDQTWVETLPRIGFIAVDVLHLVCQLAVRWNQWRWSQRGKFGLARTPLHTVFPVLLFNIHQLLEIHKIGKTASRFCVFHSGCGEYNESLREAGFSQRKQPSMHEHVFSSCPYCKPLTFPHCWSAFSRVQLYSREMPAVLHLHLCCGAADAPEESSWRFLPFANGANLPAWLIVSDVNYRMCAFVHSAACSHGSLCCRKY